MIFDILDTARVSQSGVSGQRSVGTAGSGGVVGTGVMGVRVRCGPGWVPVYTVRVRGYPTVTGY